MQKLKTVGIYSVVMLVVSVGLLAAVDAILWGSVLVADIPFYKYRSALQYLPVATVIAAAVATHYIIKTKADLWFVQSVVAGGLATLLAKILMLEFNFLVVNDYEIAVMIVASFLLATVISYLVQFGTQAYAIHKEHKKMWANFS